MKIIKENNESEKYISFNIKISLLINMDREIAFWLMEVKEEDKVNERDNAKKKRNEGGNVVCGPENIVV